MDRSIVYPGELVRNSDMLYANQDAMKAIGYVAEAMLGVGTYAYGLACIPATSGVGVVIGRGCLFAIEQIDPVAYGSLGTDTNNIMMVGINEAATSFTLTVPTTPGQSIAYLIEASWQTTDTVALVLPYYNSANPAVPLSGPANAGTAQNTRRLQSVALQLKAGAAANTGTETVPSTDTGYVPLWVIVLNYGETAVVTANIFQATGAPFFNRLTSQQIICQANLVLYVSSYGNDSNNGLSTASAFLTIQAAYNAIINNYNLNGYTASIVVGAGTFAPVVCQGKAQGQLGSTTITGAGSGTTTITSTGVNSCINAQNGSVIAISGMTLQGVYGLTVSNGGLCSIATGMVFGACSLSQITAINGQVSIQSSYSITGSAQAHWNCNVGGLVTNNSTSACTITLSPSINYSVGFAEVAAGNITTYSSAGNLIFNITGSMSGTSPRYSCLLGGSIDTGGSGVSFLPGTTAGNTGTGTNMGFYA